MNLNEDTIIILLAVSTIMLQGLFFIVTNCIRILKVREGLPELCSVKLPYYLTDGSSCVNFLPGTRS